MSIKVSDLETTEREWPLIIRSGEVLHISKGNGRDGQGHHYLVTDCGRPMRYATHLDHLEGFKLCARCGDTETFQAALDESKRLQKEHWQQHEAQRQAEIAAYSLRLEQERQLLSDLADTLEVSGLEIKRQDYSFFIIFKDQAFEVKNA